MALSPATRSHNIFSPFTGCLPASRNNVDRRNVIINGLYKILILLFFNYYLLFINYSNVIVARGKVTRYIGLNLSTPYHPPS